MILSVICEELGVFGAIVVLTLFGIMLYRLLFIARNAPDKGIEKVEPMTYPFPLEDVCLREDEVVDELSIDEILQNSGSNLYNQVKLPKVVE